MKNTIIRELAIHILDKINDGIIDNDNRDEWHYHCFNEDYYMIGYYQSSQWLKHHNIGEFEAAAICQQYEKDNFGENYFRIYDNSEKVVNMLAYIYGEELIHSIDASTIKELKKELENL